MVDCIFIYQCKIPLCVYMCQFSPRVHLTLLLSTDLLLHLSEVQHFLAVSFTHKQLPLKENTTAFPSSTQWGIRNGLTFLPDESGAFLQNRNQCVFFFIFIFRLLSGDDQMLAQNTESSSLGNTNLTVYSLRRQYSNHSKKKKEKEIIFSRERDLLSIHLFICFFCLIRSVNTSFQIIWMFTLIYCVCVSV